ncbi:MAG: hypothetical protein J5725_00490 [Bacteroidales bacterium]|nr:hypothetical protein [Bacteroidales bacterium]
MTQQELNNEVDMLEGNINRMCVTDDMKELCKMFEYARLRIERIYQYNKERLLVEEELKGGE